MASEPAKRVEIRYEVPISSPRWTLDDGLRLRLADHEDGKGLWLTGEEAARFATEAARNAAVAARTAEEAERQAKEAALAEVARLRDELAKLRG